MIINKMGVGQEEKKSRDIGFILECGKECSIAGLPQVFTGAASNLQLLSRTENVVLCTKTVEQ